mmetsp:Transcript_57795/g.133485  ORF Transcript_57795/g.133485 Transcript_57795/m.133485 type:complete len:207 (-) Transcript_57795:149-769(-)
MRLRKQAQAPSTKTQNEFYQEEGRKQVVRADISPSPFTAASILPPQAAVRIKAHVQSIEHDDDPKAHIGAFSLNPVPGLCSFQSLGDRPTDLRKSSRSSGRALPVALAPPLEPAARLVLPRPPGLTPVLAPLRLHRRLGLGRRVRRGLLGRESHRSGLLPVSLAGVRHSPRVGEWQVGVGCARRLADWQDFTPAVNPCLHSSTIRS